MVSEKVPSPPATIIASVPLKVSTISLAFPSDVVCITSTYNVETVVKTLD